VRKKRDVGNRAASLGPTFTSYVLEPKNISFATYGQFKVLRNITWYAKLWGTFAALLQCGLKLSAQACVICVKDLEALSWRHRNCCLSVGTNCWKAVQTSSSMISSCDFRMTKSSFCLKIVARRSIRLVAKALHPFPGEGFNSNGASLGTWRLR